MSPTVRDSLASSLVAPAVAAWVAWRLLSHAAAGLGAEAGDPSSDIIYTCYRGGQPGNFVKDLSIDFPYIVWWGLTALAAHLRLLYFQFVAVSWWVTYAGVIILQEILQQSGPYPSCLPGHVAPHETIVLGAHLLALVTLHRWFWREPFLELSYLIKLAAFAVAIPAVMVWSGNASIVQVLVGLVVGAFLGAAMQMAILMLGVRGRWFEYLAQTRLFGRWLGYQYEGQFVGADHALQLAWQRQGVKPPRYYSNVLCTVGYDPSRQKTASFVVPVLF